MQITETYRYRFPAYALSALFNGDYSGLDKEDAENLNSFLEMEAYIDCFGLENIEEEASFDPCPCFGLACDTVTVLGYVFGKEA